MIHQLRRRHRQLFTLLPLLLPALFVAALLARPAPPRQASLPAALLDAPSGPERAAWDDLWMDLPIRTTLYAAPRRLGLEVASELPAPDVLLYYATAPSGTDRLPDDATFLGVVDSPAHNLFALPEADRPLQLYLYSLGHQRVIGQTTLPAETD